MNGRSVQIDPGDLGVQLNHSAESPELLHQHLMVVCTVDMEI